MFKHIKIVPFAIGILIGIIGIYFFKPEKTVLIKYPTPENCMKLMYKDKNGVCYQYKSKTVDCDKNENKLKPFPIVS